VSGFQNLLKKYLAYIKPFPMKRVVSISQVETTNAENLNDDHS